MTDELHKNRLFLASCVALIATAMSFAIRGDIMPDLQTNFVEPMVAGESGEAAADSEALIKTQLGVIGTVAFFSFGLTILFGGPLVDLLGMGMLLRLAAACHIGGTLLTIFAPNYYVVVFATFIVGAGNGLVEAVCNPLIATIYPDEKTHKLTLFHAWFPGGIVIGGLLAYLFSYLGIGWQAKMGLLLIPSVIYLIMIFTEKFPATERVASGVSFGGMFRAAFSPLFLIVFAVMWLTAATELGPGAWIPDIYKDVMNNPGGILAVVWGSILMYILRQFFSKPVHAMFSPIALVAATAPLAAIGLFLFKIAETPVMFFLACTFLYVGVCFWWPTMLGIASERAPRTGALGLAILGGAGSFATFCAGPIMGRINDAVGPRGSLVYWGILPVVITIVFGIVWFNDKARGGYHAQVERLGGGDAAAE
jgi:MFS family permease